MEAWFIEEDVRKPLKGFFESFSLCSIHSPTVVGLEPEVVTEEDAKWSNRFRSRQNTLDSPLPKSAEDGERAVEQFQLELAEEVGIGLNVLAWIVPSPAIFVSKERLYSEDSLY